MDKGRHVHLQWGYRVGRWPDAETRWPVRAQHGLLVSGSGTRAEKRGHARAAQSAVPDEEAVALPGQLGVPKALTAAVETHHPGVALAHLPRARQEGHYPRRRLPHLCRLEIVGLPRSERRQISWDLYFVGSPNANHLGIG